MDEHTYTFSNESNAYFQGNDVRVERENGESIKESVKINGKDGMCAVYVKDREGSFLGSLPEDVRKLAEDLNTANKNQNFPREWPDAEYTDYLYESEREIWWADAKLLAQEAGFDGVYSAGRSGGWCCIAGTDEGDGLRIMHPEDEDDRAFRDRFLDLAFDLQDNITDRRAAWVERIREDHDELQREREECIVRGTD